MDIDKFVLVANKDLKEFGFGSLMDIDKFVQVIWAYTKWCGFGSLMDIDKFVLFLLLRKLC